MSPSFSLGYSLGLSHHFVHLEKKKSKVRHAALPLKVTCHNCTFSFALGGKMSILCIWFPSKSVRLFKLPIVELTFCSIIDERNAIKMDIDRCNLFENKKTLL